MQSCNTDDKIPLAVDLDGTLLATDLLYESLAAFIKPNPLKFFLALYWLLRHDRAYMKKQLAKRVSLDFAALPYQTDFLDWLRQQNAAGCSLYIATASHKKYAEGIAAHLSIFTGVFASDTGPNLKGQHKAACLVEAFGLRGFDYAGDANIDLLVWEKARKAVVVSNSTKLIKAVSDIAIIDRHFQPQTRQSSVLDAIAFKLWARLFH